MSRTVLIVEDTEDCRDALELALARTPGVVVRPLRTAEEALECLGSDVCALITDLNLPRMDGFELIEVVRARPGGHSLPILVVSANSDPGTPSRLAALGADGYFPKPFSPAAIRSRLEELIHVP